MVELENFFLKFLVQCLYPLVTANCEAQRDLYPSSLSSPFLICSPLRPHSPLNNGLLGQHLIFVEGDNTGIFLRHNRDTYTLINKFNHGKFALAETLINLYSYNTVLNMQSLELMRRWSLLMFFLNCLCKCKCSCGYLGIRYMYSWLIMEGELINTLKIKLPTQESLTKHVIYYPLKCILFSPDHICFGGFVSWHNQRT